MKENCVKAYPGRYCVSEYLSKVIKITESISIFTNFIIYLPGVTSENIAMCKIAHLWTILSAILIISVGNSYLLTKYKKIDAQIAHFMVK